LVPGNFHSNRTAVTALLHEELLVPAGVLRATLKMFNGEKCSKQNLSKRVIRTFHGQAIFPYIFHFSRCSGETERGALCTLYKCLFRAFSITHFTPINQYSM